MAKVYLLQTRMAMAIQSDEAEIAEDIIADVHDDLSYCDNCRLNEITEILWTELKKVVPVYSRENVALAIERAFTRGDDEE